MKITTSQSDLATHLGTCRGYQEILAVTKVIAEISPDDWAQFIDRNAQWVIKESAINGFTPQYTRVADCIVDGRKGKLKLTVEFDEVAAQ